MYNGQFLISLPQRGESAKTEFQDGVCEVGYVFRFVNSRDFVIFEVREELRKPRTYGPFSHGVTKPHGGDSSYLKSTNDLEMPCAHFNLSTNCSALFTSQDFKLTK